jgi:hypothetical protein
MKTATYLYCLVLADHAPALSGVPGGLRGMKPPRVLDAGQSLWLIAADAPLSRYGTEPIEKGLQDLDWVAACAMAHEQVIEHFARAGLAVVPMKLFTLFASDERAQRFVRDNHKELGKTMRHVAGCQEWGVRISLNRARAAEAARAGAGRAVGKASAASKGTQFLLLKKKEKDLTRTLRENAAVESDKSYKALARHGKDSRRLPIVQGDSGTSVVLDAAFLIPVLKESRFRAAVQQLSTRLAKTFDVTLSGPWPPYNFVGKTV